MKTPLALVVWAALTTALLVLSTWPPLLYILVVVGAVCGAFVALVAVESVFQNVRGTLRMHLYERRQDRERAAFLAQRDQYSRREER
ncbi:hypothetical protein AB0K21_21800 [Streptosporangium sp. NPDC049248]|uniref:hypothetical protein n=1 Tax=Streptosporangium sp. NPDC049248 TaxID=3155651 RepID=UPI003445D19E